MLAALIPWSQLVGAPTYGPRLLTLAVRQVGSYLRHTGPDANVVATTAPDPLLK
jgi:hypothetical protein